ncbi:MAG: 50S ribosomal protein L18Ae [Candidatus Bathyarchaeia archaeon]
MSEIKTYMIIGRINKPNFKTTFKKNVRALKPEDAVEEIYKLIGSKHRVKRFHIKIMKIEEIVGDEKR